MNMMRKHYQLIYLNNVPFSFTHDDPSEIPSDLPEGTQILTPNGQYEKMKNGKNTQVKKVRYTKTVYDANDQENINPGDAAYIKTNGKISSNAIDYFKTETDTSHIQGSEILSYEQLGDIHYAIAKNDNGVFLTGSDNTSIEIPDCQHADIEPYGDSLYVSSVNYSNQVSIYTHTPGGGLSLIDQKTLRGNTFDSCIFDNQIFFLYPDTKKRDYPSVVVYDLATKKMGNKRRMNTSGSSACSIYSTDDAILCVFNNTKDGSLQYCVASPSNLKKLYEEIILKDVLTFESCHTGSNFALAITKTDSSIHSMVLFHNTGTVSHGKLIPTNKLNSTVKIVPYGNCYCIIACQADYNTLFFYSIDNANTALVHSHSFVCTQTITGAMKTSSNEFILVTNSSSGHKITAEPNTFIGVVQSKKNEKISLSVSGQVSSVHEDLIPGSPYIVNGVHRGKAVSKKEILIS